MSQIFSILSYILALATASPTKADIATRLDRCEQRFRAAPNNYANSRCFVVTAKSDSEIEATRRRIKTLQRDYPQNCRLDVTLAHFHGDHAPDKRVAGYHAAARKAAQQGDIDGEIIARNNICIHHFFHDNPELGDIEAYKILALGLRAKDIQVRARGISNFANHFTRHNRNLGVAYEEMRKLRSMNIETLGYDVKRDLYVNRARLGRVFFEEELALSDFRRLYEISNVDNDDVYAILVALQGIAEIRRARYLRQAPNAPSFEQLRQDFELAISQAQQFDQIRYQARMLEEFADLLAHHGKDPAQALARINECLALCEGRYHNLYGICLARRSDITAHSDPVRSRRDATRAVEILSAAGSPELSAYAWRQVMRRMVDIESREDFLSISNAALSRINYLLYHQKDPLVRRQTSTLWTEDFYWVGSRLLRMGSSPELLRQAFQISDQVRGRYLMDLLDPQQDEDDFIFELEENDSFRVCEFCSSPKKEAKAYDVFEQPAYHSQTLDTSLSYPALLQKVKAHWKHKRQSEVPWSQELQQRLEKDETLVAFQVAPLGTHSHEGARAFVLTRDSIQSISLTIDSKQIAEGTRIVRDQIFKDSPDVQQSIHRLRELVTEPLSQAIPKKTRRLIIVPDGPLSALPFSVLFDKYEISVATSARSWLAFRRDREHWQAPKGLIVVDPQREKAKRNVSSIFAYRSWTDELQNSPLPQSRKEVGHILKHLGPKMSSLVGAQATKANVVEQLDVPKNLLHISAHSFVNINSPDESAIVLSNQDSEALVGDDLLRIREIEGLPVQNTFVVLGGCSTGFGAAISGEGVLSIASAFQRAGAPAVLASLWPVRDEQAAEFFSIFYRYLGQGLSLDEALQHSQIESQQRGHAMVDYAGFVLLGDGSLRFEQRSPTLRKSLAMLGIALCIGILSGLWRRRRRQDTLVS